MPVITVQTGPLLSAQYAQTATGTAVQGQGGAQPADASDWRSALAELDALLQAALPDTAQAGNAASASAPAASMSLKHEVAAEPAFAEIQDGTAGTQTMQAVLHASLRRFHREAPEEPAGSEAQSADSPLAAPTEINTVLLRQLNAPVAAQTSNAKAEARADMTIDVDALRGDRTQRPADLQAQFPRANAANQAIVDAPRLESAPAAIRLEGLVAERPQMLNTPMPAVQGGHEWAPLKLGDQSAQWGRQLLDTLRERVEMQVNQQVKQAHIRLDPPEMGRLELTVRLDGDHLSVQINSNHAQLRDALLQTGERLRAALMPQHAGGVSVDVGQGSGGDRSGQPRGDRGILAGRRSSPELDADLNELAPVGWLNTLV